MDNKLENFTIIANALYNDLGIVKIVETRSGKWHTIDMNKVLTFDYVELVNFQKIFNISKPGDNQVMLSKKLAISLLDKFKNKHFTLNRDVLKDDNFKEIANIVIGQNLFNNPDELKSLGSSFQVSLKSYQSILINEISKNIQKFGKVDNDHIFYQLDSSTQESIILYMLDKSTHTDNEVDVTSLQKVVKIFGSEKASNIIQAHKTFPFIKKIFFNDAHNQLTRKWGKEYIDVYREFFKNELNDTHISAIIKDCITNRYLEKIDLLRIYYPNLVEDQMVADNYYKLIPHIYGHNKEKIGKFLVENFKIDVWSNSGYAIKVLYHEHKRESVQNLLELYPFNYDEYLLIKDFLFKRAEKEAKNIGALKTNKKLDDFNHFEKILEIKAFEVKLEREIPKVNNVERKLKF